jgi:predicted methyltransferase
MHRIATLIIGLLGAGAAFAADLPVEARIEQAMLGDHRAAANVERNRYRHPVGTLTFLGLQDGMTVLEIWPGGGWYTEVLAPVVRHHGQFIVAGYDADVPDQPEYRYRLQKALLDKFAAHPEIYDQVAVVPYSPPASASLGEPESVDLVLTFRNAHGWYSGGIAESVVQHRAADDADPAKSAEMGYLPERTVIDLARKAGLYLEARSEVNANPADTKDYEHGVWSLPPGFAICDELEDEDETAACRDRFRAIGESDRMTLRFRKPLG